MAGFSFAVEARDGRARAGRLAKPHGEVETPVFMPVGTAGAVKAVLHRDLREIGARILLANTYHLMLRPGDVQHSLADIGRARDWLGYAPTHGVRDGLVHSAAWYAGRLTGTHPAP